MQFVWTNLNASKRSSKNFQADFHELRKYYTNESINLYLQYFIFYSNDCPMFHGKCLCLSIQNYYPYQLRSIHICQSKKWKNKRKNYIKYHWGVKESKLIQLRNNKGMHVSLRHTYIVPRVYLTLWCLCWCLA